MWDSEHILYALAIIGVIAMPFVIRLRRRSQQRFMADFSDREVCEHLRPALDHLKARGHVVSRAGQKSPDFPLEIHLAPPFDPRRLADELNLTEPVFVSDRNVLFCREDLCELHPVKQ
jgi:beta-glucosidase-like glycosyl hydrolase